ncbi:MAG: RND transporter [bacterium]|nr:RND transporter [bacterium]
MYRFQPLRKLSFPLLACVALYLCGCAPADSSNASGSATSGDSAAEASAVEDNTTDEHDHSGWWCNEHGVPEELCTRCNSTLIADFKAKDDWCDEHDRPHSQCFLCSPELEAQFAARYEAKYGEQPPKPTDP